MDPIIGGAIIGAGANLLGQGANAFASKKANKRMVDFWRMQNEYNSPRQQMQRLQEGGLNPNLIYGDGISGATGRAESIGTPDKPQFESPVKDILMYQNIRQAKAQASNLEEQNKLLKQEQKLKEFGIQDAALDLLYKKTDRSTQYAVAQSTLREKIARAQLSEYQADILFQIKDAKVKAEIAKAAQAATNATNAEKLGMLRDLEATLKESQIKFYESNQIVSILTKLLGIR